MTNTIETEFRFTMVPEWLLDSGVTGDAILLYVALGRYADSQTHEAYPSRKTLAGRCRMSATSVDRASAELVKVGAIAKRQRQNNSLVYTLYLSPRVKAPVTTGAESLSPPAEIAVTTGGDLTITTKREPEEREPLNDKTAIVSHTGELFDKFWTTYPNSNDKPRARREFDKAIKRVGFEKILAGAVKYRDDPNRSAEYTKHPSTWLHNDSWDNPLLPAPAVKARKLTNAEEGALLAQRERGLEQAALEQGTAAGQLEADVTNMFRSI
jgi:hypothetical protein